MTGQTSPELDEEHGSSVLRQWGGMGSTFGCLCEFTLLKDVAAHQYDLFTE